MSIYRARLNSPRDDLARFLARRICYWRPSRRGGVSFCDAHGAVIFWMTEIPVPEGDYIDVTLDVGHGPTRVNVRRWESRKRAT